MKKKNRFVNFLMVFAFVLTASALSSSYSLAQTTTSPTVTASPTTTTSPDVGLPNTGAGGGTKANLFLLAAFLPLGIYSVALLARRNSANQNK